VESRRAHPAEPSVVATPGAVDRGAGDELGPAVSSTWRRIAPGNGKTPWASSS
jgi:hypothetical protein